MVERSHTHTTTGAQQTLELEVAGEEKFSLGECQYKVLVVRQTIQDGGREVDAWSALYSPELEATLAKRYDEGTAQELTVGYTSIRPLHDDNPL